MKIYLAGPINGCSDDEATTWRDWFKNGTRFPDVPGSKQHIQSAKYIDPMKRDYRGKELTDYREIVDLDKLDIQAADVVVVMYDWEASDHHQ